MAFIKEEGFLYKSLNFIANIMILNFCFIFGSLGIVTIGTSLSSAYYACLKFIDNSSNSIIQDYFSSYKLNIKNTIISFILNIFINLSLIIYLFIFDNRIFQVVIIFLIILLNGVFNIYFLIESKFKNNFLVSLKNSFILFVMNIKRTILTSLIMVLTIYFTFYTSLTFYISIGIYLLFGFGLYVYINTLILKKVIEKYL